MNKTITLMAVVLGLLTAFLMVSGGMDADEIDYNGYDYFVIDDADTVCYTDATLPEDVDDCNGRIAITSDTVMENAFKDCTRIKHVYFDGTESIGDHAFDGCTNLYTVAAESGLESIGSYAFKNCSKFYSAKFPSTLETLGSGCFFGCSKLIGSVLLGTSVTTIPSYAFADSGILIEDLRNVTTIAATAFNGTSLKAQVLSEGQSKKVAGVDAIYVADFAIKNLQMYSVTVGSDTDYYASFKVNKNVSLMSRALDGSCSANNSEDQPWVYGSVCEFKMDGDLHLELLKYRIVFEDYLNMADVVHTSGTGTYAMPSPSIGASIFSGWRIAGLSGLKTSLTEAEFQTAGLLIEPVAEFQTLTLTLDHSAVSGSADYASLPTEMEFTVNDSYPAQADIAGFTFSGWRCGEIFYAAGTKIANFANHTVTSEWNALMHTLTLVKHDSTTTQQNISEGATVDLSALVVDEPDGKRFIGWSLTSGGTLLTVNPVMDDDLTLYSVFTDRTLYTVRYYDGTTVLGTQTGYDGRTVVLDMDDPVSQGRTFTGWMMGEQEVESGDSIVITGDVNILSMWNGDMLNVTYHVGSNAVSSYAYGTVVTVDCDPGENPGYMLSGWSTTQNGPVVYTQGNTFELVNNTDLYPCWVSNGMCTVTLHSYLGTASQTEVEPGSDYTIPQQTARQGKTFSGWAVTLGGNPVYATGQVLLITDDTHLYEIWSDIVYYSVNVHTYNGMTGTNVASGGSFQLPAVAEREGYTFRGWSDTANGAVLYLDGQSIHITSEKDVYQVWEAKPTFTVTVHSDPIIQQSGYVGQNISVTLPNMSRTGYNLRGWSTADGGAVQYSASQSVTSTTTTDYYPVWAAKTQYTVSVEKADGTFATQSVYSGDSITLPAKFAKKDGRSHEGWTKSTDGTGRLYAPGSSLYVSENITLHAAWSDPEMLKITLNDGDETVGTINVLRDTQCTLVEVPDKEGYRFIGWSDGDEVYDIGDSLTVTEDVTLEAVWEKLVMITFRSGTSSEAVYFENGDDIEFPELSLPGYTLAGWSLSPDGGAVTGLKAEEDTVLYAVWEEIVESQSEAPSKGGSGISVTTIGIGAAVAAAIAAVIAVQIRRS